MARDWKCVRDAPSPSLTVYGIRTFKRKCLRDTVPPALYGEKFFVPQALRGDLTSRTRHSAVRVSPPTPICGACRTLYLHPAPLYGVYKKTGSERVGRAISWKGPFLYGLSAGGV